MSAEKIVTEVALSAISSDIKEAIYNTLPDVVIPASSICSFDTGISAKLKNCACDIQGSQDLNGYTKPWAGGTGKNLVYEVIAGANINSDGSIASGQPYALACAKVVNGETYTATTQEGQFVGGFFSSKPAVGSATYDNNRVEQNSKTITAPIDGYVVFRMPEEYTTLPQLEVGSSATSYEPYENFCPITAFNKAEVSHDKKNLFINNHISASSSGVTYTANADGTISLTGTATSTVFIAPMGSTGVFYPAGTYTMKKSGNANIQMLMRTNDLSGDDAMRATTVDVTRNLAGGIYVCLVRIASGTVTDGITLYPQVEVGSISTDYAPYEAGETITVNFTGAGTVYKGSLNVTTGVLTVTHAVVDLGSLNWVEKGTGTTGIYRMRAALDSKAIPNNQTFDAVCEKYVAESANATYSLISGISGDESGAFIWVYDPNYNTSSSASAFKTSVNGTHLAYELASPAVYNLTANEITALLGNNVIFADVGDTALTYKDLSTRGVTWKDITGTLSAGSTSITLSDDVITTSSTIDVYTDTFGINPTNMTATTGSVTLTFESQASNLGVKVRVS